MCNGGRKGRGLPFNEKHKPSQDCNAAIWWRGQLAVWV
jgi:hypothetical protein